MKQKEVENGSSEVKTHTAAPTQSLAGKKKFSWLVALPVMVAVAIVGIFIVFNTFAATASESYVRDLYTGLLGRTPATTDSGVKYWAGQIDTGKATKAAVYTALYNSSEAKNYRAKLIKSGNYSVPGAASGQTPSSDKSIPNKTVQNALTAEQCVVNAYKPRTPDAKGKAFWIAQIAKGKTCVDVTNRIQAVISSSTKSSKTTKTTNNAPISAKACKARLIKEFKVPSYDTTDKHVGMWLKNQYIRYQGYAAGYRPGQNPKGQDYQGWELGDEGKELLGKIVNCEMTGKQALDVIKSGEGAKKWTEEKQAYFESYEKPIAKVYQDVLRAAIQASGRNYTCWYTSKKTGKQVDMLTDPEFANTIPFYKCFTDIGLPKPPTVTGVDLVALYAAGKIDLAGAAQAIQGGAVGVCEEPSENPFAPNTPQPASCGGGSATYTQQELQQAVSEASSQQAEESGVQQSSRGFGAASGTMSNTR